MLLRTRVQKLLNLGQQSRCAHDHFTTALLIYFKKTTLTALYRCQHLLLLHFQRAPNNTFLIQVMSQAMWLSMLSNTNYVQLWGRQIRWIVIQLWGQKSLQVTVNIFESVSNPIVWIKLSISLELASIPWLRGGGTCWCVADQMDVLQDPDLGKRIARTSMQTCHNRTRSLGVGCP